MQSMPDMTELLKIAQSPAGQKLLTMLRASNGTDLSSITSAAASGNLEAAKQQLSGILNNKEVQELLKQLEKAL
jgi:hypothetical protein